jgi:peptide/nickel transport system permease protein
MSYPEPAHVVPSADVVMIASTSRRWQFGRVGQRFVANRATIVALGFLFLLTAVALLEPLLPLQDPNSQSISDRLEGPSSGHWLGTDSLGRDTLSRLFVGARVTLLAATQGLVVSVVLGVPLGLMAGYAGGVLDGIMSRIADTLLSVPPLILALAIIGLAGPGLTIAMVAVGISLAPRFFRVARSAAETVSGESYIEAHRSVGCSGARVLFRHVLPNAAGPLLVQVSFGIGLVITAEASLSFLGLGVQIPQASWGSMLNGAFQSIYLATFPLVPPAIALVLTVMCFFVVGDALRDAVGRSSRQS